ncbi:hypothetical protein JOB18_020359, partial [Solea senegalensis]
LSARFQLLLQLLLQLCINPGYRQAGPSPHLLFTTQRAYHLQPARNSVAVLKRR